MSLRPPAGIATPSGTLESGLDQHRIWLESHGREGSRLDLAVCDLRTADLRQRDLRQAGLAMANFSGADLSRAKLCGANLVAANFRHAILCNTDFSDFEPARDGPTTPQTDLPLNISTTLDGADFSGADMTIAKLPGRFAFTRQVREIAAHARRVRRAAIAVGILLVAELFLIGAVRDERLLLPEWDAASSLLWNLLTGKIALLGVGFITLVGYGFLIAGPLRKLCPARYQIPARLPDGAAIDANRALWPLNMLAARWIPLLGEDRQNWRAKTPVWLTLGALFVAAPAMSLLAWWRILAIHEWWSSAVLAVAAASATGLARFGWRNTAEALAGPGVHHDANGKRGRSQRLTLRAAVAALLSAAALLALSYAVVEVGLAPYLGARVDIAFHNFSDYPPGVLERSITAVHGPNLAGRNLRYARLAYSSLVSADLRNTRLDCAEVTVTDLRRANLAGADLREATLFASNLESANLTNADLRGATLHCAVGLESSQLAAARTDEATILPDGSPGPFYPGSRSLTVNADDCAHWSPTDAPPVFRLPPPLAPTSGTLPAGESSEQPGIEEKPPEPDLSPIPELKPSRKPPAQQQKD